MRAGERDNGNVNVNDKTRTWMTLITRTSRMDSEFGLHHLAPWASRADVARRDGSIRDIRVICAIRVSQGFAVAPIPTN